MHRLYPRFVGGPGATGLLVVRLVVGTAFVMHGLGKIQSPGGPLGWMPEEAPVPGFLQAIAAFTEFGGGAALVLGLLTPIAAAGLAFTMIAALGMVHIPAGHPFVNPTGPSAELA